MWRSHSFARTTGLVVAIAVAVVLACDDEPTAPPPAPAMDTAWPNADGLAWVYDLTARAWDNVPRDCLCAATPEAVPPLPPLQEFAARLATPVSDAPPDAIASARYRLRFRGMVATQSGVYGQHLLAEVLSPTPAKASVSPGTEFLRRLAAARPGLRARIAAVYPELAAESEGTPFPTPLFLAGGVFEKTAAYIGRYSLEGWDSGLAWKWLEPNVSAGHEFVLQLVPSLARDVLLCARVLGSRTVSGPSGTKQRVIDVVYAVDYGVAAIGDESVSAYMRAYDYGSIAFAVGVGPVESIERPWCTQLGLRPLLELTSKHRLPPADLD